MRALYAIPYPFGPLDAQDGAKGKKRKNEGCIVVAASDKSVKFHEVWGFGEQATGSALGLLGGSDILEGLEGNEKEGEIIR